VEAISYKTVSGNKLTVKKEWVVVDAENEILGRLASRVAMILRGKHKPSYTPHADCGDNVIIINAEKIRMTGKKFTDRFQTRYTGYPGGQRVFSAEQLMAKNPAKIIEVAVKGMLPKTRLGRAVYGHLRVIVGTEHKYIAQQPTVINLNDIK